MFFDAAKVSNLIDLPNSRLHFVNDRGATGRASTWFPCLIGGDPIP